jgi:hypothetical protein
MTKKTWMMWKPKRKPTGRPAFGNPATRSAATLWKMGANKRRIAAERWTSKLVKFSVGTRTL